MENLTNTELDLINAIQEEIKSSRSCLVNNNCNMNEEEILNEINDAKHYLTASYYISQTLKFPPKWTKSFMSGKTLSGAEQSEITTILCAIYYLANADKIKEMN